MSILKKILLVLLAFSGFVLLTALFVDGDLKVQQSIDINAPVGKVWNFTSSITALNSWNVWFTKDKMMRTSISGNDGDPGSLFCWESDSTELGKGCLKLAQLTTLRNVELDIHFYVPYKIRAKAYVSLQPRGNATRVTLNLNARSPYPLSILKVLKSSEKRIAANYALSLQKLKRLSESP